MALHTNILQNGEWVTQTIDVYSILSKQAPSSSKKQATKEQLPPPTCGLLTTTIAESPQIKHILPVRLRSLRHNDVAIIGVSLPSHEGLAPGLKREISDSQ